MALPVLRGPRLGDLGVEDEDEEGGGEERGQSGMVPHRRERLVARKYHFIAVRRP